MHLPRPATGRHHNDTKADPPPLRPNVHVGENEGMAGTAKNPKPLPRGVLHTPPRPGIDDPLATLRVEYLVDQFGGARLAKLIGVNRSQPTRWAAGTERPGPTAAPLLMDLEHVLARARLVWGEAAAHTWLESPNSFLEGARPLDVLRLHGPAPVLEALDAEAWGGAS